MKIFQSQVTDDEIGMVEPSEKKSFLLWWPRFKLCAALIVMRTTALARGCSAKQLLESLGPHFSCLFPLGHLVWETRKRALDRIGLASACEMHRHVEMLGKARQLQVASQALQRQQQQQQKK